MKQLILFFVSVLSAHAAEPTQDFSAMQFFETVHPAIARPAHLPERVTFEVIQISESEMDNALLGSWRMQMSCDGRPVVFNPMNTPYFDGLVRESLVQNFQDNNVLTIHRNRGALQTIADDKIAVEKGFWMVVDVGNRLTISTGGYPHTIKMAKIVQTGEVVMLRTPANGDDGEFQSLRPMCPGGKGLKFVMTRAPVM